MCKCILYVHVCVYMCVCTCVCVCVHVHVCIHARVLACVCMLLRHALMKTVMCRYVLGTNSLLWPKEPKEYGHTSTPLIVLIIL